MPTTATTLRNQEKLPIKPQSPAASDRHRWQWQSGLASLALLLAGIALLEVFFNACGVGFEEILKPDPQLGTVHIPGKKVVWRMEGFSSDSFNQSGMRDYPRSLPKPLSVKRIAMLGDSATEGLQVPLKDTYGRQLELLLGRPGQPVEALNFGCSGYSTGQEVIQFEQQVAKYQPDVVLLLYNRGDNIENIRRPDDLKAEPRPYFYIDASGNLKEDDAVLKASRQALAPNPLVDFLRAKSRLYGVFTHANLTLSLNEWLYRKLRGWVLFPFTAATHRPGYNLPFYPPQDGWRVTAALIRRLDSDCRQHHCKLLIVTFPNVNQDKEFAGQIANLQKLAAELGCGFFDLTTPFRWDTDPMSLFVKYHFSSKGHRFVAQRLFPHIPLTNGPSR